MRKSALLIAAAFVMVAPSFAFAARHAGKKVDAVPPMPCCQDTLRLFWHGADAWRTPNTYVAWKPTAWKPYTPPPAGTPMCCKETIALFWRGVDSWAWNPEPAKA